MDCDFELEFREGAAQGQYSAHVVRAPAGGRAASSFELDVGPVLDRLKELETTILASAVQARRTASTSESSLQQLGGQLFSAVFTREIYGAYRASLGAAASSGRRLRVVLSLTAPQLAALPWELLFDPGTETYLCRTEPLLRTIPAEDFHPAPLPLSHPLRILGVVSSPRGLPELDVETEQEHLEHALAGQIASGGIELVWAKEATWEGLHEKLLNGPWHALHFIGHGDYDIDSDEGQIILVDNNGRASRVDADRLIDLLSTASPMPRLVLLNSCYSGRGGEQDLFSGTSAALVRGGVSAVVAMQFTVSDAGAAAFARGFYAALAAGRAVDEATRNGRIAMRGVSAAGLEWVTPVLYARGGATELFALTEAAGAVKQPLTAAVGEAPTAAAEAPAAAAQPPAAAEQPPKAAAKPIKAKGGATPQPGRAGVVLPRLELKLDVRVNAVAFRPDGLRLATGASDKTWRIWDAVTGAENLRIKVQGPFNEVGAVAFSPDGGSIGTCNLFGTAAVWDTTTGVQTWTRNNAGHDLAFSPDGTRLLTGHSVTARIHVWGTATGAEQLNIHASGILGSVVFGKDAALIAAGSTKAAWLWDATSGEELLRFDDEGHAMQAVAFDAVGSRLVAGGGDRVTVWDAGSGERLLAIDVPGSVWAVASSPDGTRLATASQDKTARLWDARTGEQLLELQHGGWVLHVAFSPDGQSLATASRDGTARIWGVGGV